MNDNLKPITEIENLKTELTRVQGVLIHLCDCNSLDEYAFLIPESRQCVMMILVNSKDRCIRYIRDRERILIQQLNEHGEELPSLLQLLHATPYG